MGSIPQAGVDEAGRGAVLGPLVVAGVLAEGEEELRRLGVRDSKKLSPLKRAELAEVIASSFPHSIRVLSPREVDGAVLRGRLNDLEAQAFGEVLRALGARRAWVDSADVRTEHFARSVRRAYPPCEVVAEHKADENYAVVSAASILAKVTRDRAIEEMAKVYGEMGSGYPSDPKTLRFLEEYGRRWGCLPPEARSSWETARRILGRSTTLEMWGIGP